MHAAGEGQHAPRHHRTRRTLLGQGQPARQRVGAFHEVLILALTGSIAIGARINDNQLYNPSAGIGDGEVDVGNRNLHVKPAHGAAAAGQCAGHSLEESAGGRNGEYSSSSRRRSGLKQFHSYRLAVAEHNGRHVILASTQGFPGSGARVVRQPIGTTQAGDDVTRVRRLKTRTTKEQAAISLASDGIRLTIGVSVKGHDFAPAKTIAAAVLSNHAVEIIRIGVIHEAVNGFGTAVRPHSTRQIDADENRAAVEIGVEGGHDPPLVETGRVHLDIDRGHAIYRRLVQAVRIVGQANSRPKRQAIGQEKVTDVAIQSDVVSKKDGVGDGLRTRRRGEQQGKKHKKRHGNTGRDRQSFTYIHRARVSSGVNRILLRAIFLIPFNGFVDFDSFPERK